MKIFSWEIGSTIRSDREIHSYGFIVIFESRLKWTPILQLFSQIIKWDADSILLYIY